jgi:hypothetical protein
MAGNVSNIYYGFIRSRTAYNVAWAAGLDKIYTPSRDCRPTILGRQAAIVGCSNWVVLRLSCPLLVTAKYCPVAFLHILGFSLDKCVDRVKIT